MSSAHPNPAYPKIMLWTESESTSGCGPPASSKRAPSPREPANSAESNATGKGSSLPVNSGQATASKSKTIQAISKSMSSS